MSDRRGGRVIKKLRPSLRWTRGRGGFPIENKRKTTPAASALVASQHFLDDAATPPCGGARRGITHQRNSFTSSMTADSPTICDIAGGHRPPLTGPNASFWHIRR